MYEGSKIIISGHTRIEQLRQLGVIEVPINRLPRTENMPAEGEIDPMHDDVIREHAISNTRVNTTVFGRYSYAREIMAARVDGFNIDLKTSDHNIPRKQYLEIIKTAGIGDDSFKLIEDIRFGYSKTYKDKDCFVEARPDLYDDLKNPAKDYAVRQLYKWQWEAFRVANFNDAFPQQDFMDDTLDTLNFNNVINAVYKNLASIEAAALTDDYPGINWFNDTDDNFLIKDRDNNDISSLEVKTTFGKTKWSSGSNKTGYGLFFAYNKERDRFFAVSTFVGETEWTDMGKGAFEMRVETLYNKDDNEVKYYLGDIEVDNDVYRIQKYRATQ
jgi:hypothetical protein